MIIMQLLHYICKEALISNINYYKNKFIQLYKKTSCIYE